MYTWIKEVGTQFLHRKSNIVDSKSSFNYVKENTVYEVTIRGSKVFGNWEDIETKRLNDDIYISSINAPTYQNIKQNVTMPSETGNINLTWNKYPNRSSRKVWDNILSVIKNHAKINYNTITPIGDIDPTPNKYFGGVVIPDGRVLAVPYDAEQIAIIDIVNGTVEKIGEPDTMLAKFAGGALVCTNKVVLAPFNTAHTQLSVLDLSDFSIAKIGTLLPDLNKFYGAISLADGRVECVPHQHRYIIEEYDPFAETYKYGGSTSNNYCGAVLLDNTYYYVLVPHLAANKSIGLANQFGGNANFKEQGSVIQNIAKKYAGGVTLENNRALLIPHSASQFCRFDYDANTITLIGDIDPTPNKYFGGVLLPDNRVLAVPYDAEQIAIIDPISGIVEKIGTPDSTPGKFIGGNLLPNGRVILHAHNAPQSVIVSASDRKYGALIDLEGCLSGYLNKF